MTEIHFFDINSILMSEGLIEIELLVDSFNLDSIEFGYLNFDKITKTNKNGELSYEITSFHLEDCVSRQTRFKFPLWLITDLAKLKLINIRLSKFFQDKYIKYTLPSPELCDLRGKFLFYFGIGTSLAIITKNYFLQTSLSKILLDRLKRLMILILFKSQEDTADSLLVKLTHSEQEFYNKGMEYMESQRLWKLNRVQKTII